MSPKSNERIARTKLRISKAEVSAVLASPALGTLRAAVLFAHGAGADMDHPFMRAVHEGLAARGAVVLRFNFRYTEQGRGAPDRPPVLLDTMRAALLSEHEDLAAIDQEDQLHQLVMGVPAPRQEVVQRLLVPLEALGRSLRESDFRQQFGIQVVALEQPDGTLQCPPDPDAPLRSDQRLVAVVYRNED